MCLGTSIWAPSIAHCSPARNFQSSYFVRTKLCLSVNVYAVSTRTYWLSVHFVFPVWLLKRGRVVHRVCLLNVCVRCHILYLWLACNAAHLFPHPVLWSCGNQNDALWSKSHCFLYNCMHASLRFLPVLGFLWSLWPTSPCIHEAVFSSLLRLRIFSFWSAIRVVMLSAERYNCFSSNYYTL